MAVSTQATHGVATASGATISYTPTAGYSGSDSFTYTATGEGGTSAPATVTIVVSRPILNVAPPSLPNATVGSSYAQGLSSTNGTPPYTFAVTAGLLPPGLILNGSGHLSGSPTAAGTFTFTVIATDSLGATGGEHYRIVVVNPPPIAGNSSLTVQGGSSNNPVTLNLSGGPAASVAVATQPSNGAATASGTSITYTPNYGFSGSDSFTFNATGPGGTSQVATVSVSVIAPSVVITPGSLTIATQHTAYSLSLSASGGTAPYSFSLSNSALPAGLTLSTAGALVGTPTSPGTTIFIVRATDSSGFYVERTYVLTVNSQPASAGTVSATVAANSSANPIPLNLSGGTATSVAVETQASHGTATANGTSISYTPNAGYSGSDSFTYTATGGGVTSAPATVSLTVTAPTLTLTPTKLASATANTAHSQTLNASGGTGPYSFRVTSGALPTGFTLSSGGILSGTPTVPGTFNLTVEATDSLGATGTQSYSLSVADQAPVVSAVSATVVANSAANPIALNLSGGAATSVSVTSAPSHGTTSVSGTSLSYTPAAGYSGSDSFSYSVTGPGGTSASATVSLTITAPTLAITPSTPSLPGASQGLVYSVSLAAGGGMAPYNYTLNGNLPAGLLLDSATGAITGTPTAVTSSTFTIGVTDANGASGTRSYSLAVVAQIVVVPPSSEALAPGQAASVDLTRGASGGPFLRARLLSVSPASAGTASLSDPLTLRFMPAAAFAGSAVVSFSLENTGGNTATSTVTFSVQPRPDPTRDSEVIGLLNAQSRAAERFASTQMDNFNHRLEQLHRASCDRDSFNANVSRGRDNVSLGSLGSALRDELEGKGADPDDDEQRRKEKDSARASAGECTEQAVAFWTDGFVNTGSNKARGAKDNSFTTFGLSAGMDYRLSPNAVIGIGIGYGNDRTDIGEHDSRSEGDALGLAVYLSANPLSGVYIDALLGYNRISFDSRRFVTADPSNGYADGSRDADQLFASLTASYEYRQGALSLAPYVRVNSSFTRLDGYSEHGGGIYALSYEQQDLRYFTSFLGWRTSYDIQTRLGVLTPRLGLAWGHNFNRNQDYRMRYADQGNEGVLYLLSPDPVDTNFIDMDSGLDLSLGRAWRVALSFKTALGTNERNEMFRIGLDGKF